MTLRIYFKSDKSYVLTTNYLTVENVDNWSATQNLLTVAQNGNVMRYFPLQNIESFMEIENEN